MASSRQAARIEGEQGDVAVVDVQDAAPRRQKGAGGAVVAGQIEPGRLLLRAEKGERRGRPSSSMSVRGHSTAAAFPKAGVGEGGGEGEQEEERQHDGGGMSYSS